MDFIISLISKREPAIRDKNSTSMGEKEKDQEQPKREGEATRSKQQGRETTRCDSKRRRGD